MVEQANRTMLLYVYAAVIVLCFITFRSWRAVVVAVVPLALTSILCEALMVVLGIGVKVATLPVIALGVGNRPSTMRCTCCPCSSRSSARDFR